jgi:hypothetical protein
MTNTASSSNSAGLHTGHGQSLWLIPAGPRLSAP